MKKWIIRYGTVLLCFLAGIGVMSYATRMRNRDMTTTMAEATLPVAFAEQDGQLFNEMHGYVQPMDGSYMKDTVIGVSEDHVVGLAVEKYNAEIESVSYEVRSLDMSRLIESGEGLQGEDDGRYLHFSLELKDLLAEGELYLLVLNVQTHEHGDVWYYSQLSYQGENHIQECVDFALEFHNRILQKDMDYILPYLESDSSMDGSSLGYVNIHSRTGPMTWGDMQIERTTDPELTFTGVSDDVASLKLQYQIRNTQTGESYQVEEAYRVRYTSTRMYLLAYERTADRIFEPGSQLVEDGRIQMGIQSEEVNWLKNEEENVIGFVQQGQLWSFDFGQNRLSLVYGFADGDDGRGTYDAHDFRILSVEDSGSMDFLVYGYMNRGRYEGMSGVLLCRYDALLNTVEEQFFLPSDHPYQAVKEELGALAAENANGTAWLSYGGQILQINLADCSVQVLEENVSQDDLKISGNGALAAWTAAEGTAISLLDVQSGRIREIRAESGEVLRALGFMEEDFIYGTAYASDIVTNLAGEETIPMYRVVIRDHSGNEVREFNYTSRGKYVVGVTIVENRIDLECVSRQEDGSYTEALPEPITYTSESEPEQLVLTVKEDETRRNEYGFDYSGTLKNGSMRQPRVRLVLYEDDRTLEVAPSDREFYLAYTFAGEASGFETLSAAVRYADEEMGSVWRDGFRCFWERGAQATRAQLDGFEIPETAENTGDSLAQCLQLLLRQKQIYTDVQGALNAGNAAWEICRDELGDSCCLLPGCSLDEILYYISAGAPVMAVTDTGSAVLIVGYDAQNIVYYEPGQSDLRRAGMNDSASMFEAAGNLFFTYLP